MMKRREGTSKDQYSSVHIHHSSDTPRKEKKKKRKAIITASLV